MITKSCKVKDIERVKIGELVITSETKPGTIDLLIDYPVQQGIQLTALGANMRARLAYYLIYWGCRLASIVGN